MVKNIVEKAITPYNPSSNKVLNKDKYNLFAPMADVNKPGMAGYNPAHFEVRNQIVSLSSLYTAGIQKEIADVATRIDAETWKVNGFTNYTGDMNNLFISGSYLCQGYNVPEPNQFIVFVLDTKTIYFVQYAISAYGNVYIRYGQRIGNSWSSWEKLTFDSTVDAVKGQVQTLSDRLNSLVIGNKQEIYTIVNTLPEEGLTDKIYLVPVIEPESQNKFDEYLWVNSHWEYFGRSTISIDTSTLVTKQDFLVGSSAPTSSTVAPFVGALYLDSNNNNTYQCTAITTSEGGPITYTWVKLIRETDYASSTTAGIGYVASSFQSSETGGITLGNSQTRRFTIIKAPLSLIRTRVSNGYEDANTSGPLNCLPIVSANLDFAFKQCFVNPKQINVGSSVYPIYEAWTDNDRDKARKFLGIPIETKKFLLGCNIKLPITSVSNGVYTSTINTKVSVGDYLITADNAYLQIATVTENPLQMPSDDYIKPTPDAVTMTTTTTYTITFSIASGDFTAVANDFFYVAHSNGTKILSAYYTASELDALAEDWTFTLEDGSTVTKKVVVLE